MNRTTPMKPEDDVRETPPELFDKLNAEFRFTLDACADATNAKLPRYNSEAEPDKFSWRGERVWCNPPFSQISQWVFKAWESQAQLVCMLVPATRTEQGWWQDGVELYRDLQSTALPGGWRRLQVRFLRGRTRFLKDGKPMGSPKFGCCLLVWSR
jgi:phage N-6-adenine-methyltransferase